MRQYGYIMLQADIRLWKLCNIHSLCQRTIQITVTIHEKKKGENHLHQ
jgi:hypothetical protein